MGRRIMASFLLVLAVGLAEHPLALSQASAEDWATLQPAVPPRPYHPGLMELGATRQPPQGAAQDWWATLLRENFEGDFPGSSWTLAGDPTWGTTSFRAYGGGSSAYCAGGGSGAVSAPGPYANGMDAWMIYGPFDLSQAMDAEVQLSFWNDTESEVDYLGLAAAPDGADWHLISWWSGDWINECFGWCQDHVSLTNVEGLGNLCGRSFVWIAFLFHSDGDTQAEGSYLDDITLRALFPGVQPSATPTSTPTSAWTPTPTATATSTATPTQTATPTPTPAGSYGDPIPAACDAIYSGNTASYPATVSDYGSCGSGMSGPEVVYALDLSQSLATLELDFAGGTQRQLFLLAADGGTTCLGSTAMSQSLLVRDLPAARYFIAVDGTAPGSYVFSIHCSTAATPTPTRSPTATSLARRIVLPLLLKSSTLALSQRR